MASTISAVGSPALRRFIKSAINSTVYPAIAFVAAFRLDWPRGWLHAEVFVLASVLGTMIVQAINPSVLEARDRNRDAQRSPFDRIFYRLFVPLVLLYPAIGGLDGGRFAWAPLPFWTSYLGAGLFILGSVITTWTLLVNTHAERIFRVQDERGHTVITTGPYRLVRHPMYLGSIIGFPMTALMLGSGVALVPMAQLVALFVWRTAREDDALKAGLDGYTDYAARTRYRLIPGVW